MKRLSMTVLICFIALVLSACGRSAAPQATAAPTAEPTAAETKAAGEVSVTGATTPEAAAARIQGDPDAVYLFAANVGKGDALVLRAGDWVGLIDAGKARARGRVRQALALMGAGDRLDGVFLTHTDDDHAGGLRWLAGEAGLAVENVYASAMYTGVKEAKHPATEAAGDLGLAVRWLRRGDGIPLGDSGAVLKVLAPASLYTDKDDNNSLVMMLESPQGKILLTGDMELPEEAELLSFGDDLKCDVLKVANHGDDDTTSAAFADACGAKLAVISTDGQEKPGTPDPGVVQRLRAAGSDVRVTEGSGLGILVTLKGGAATAEYVDFGAAATDGLYIAEADPEDDRVVLGNRTDATIPLDGCYLYSDRGDELFPFPDGALIGWGETLIVGTNSTKGDYDLLWDDKKVINQKKADAIYLYDPWGRVVDWTDNGVE